LLVSGFGVFSFDSGFRDSRYHYNHYSIIHPTSILIIISITYTYL